MEVCGAEEEMSCLAQEQLRTKSGGSWQLPGPVAASMSPVYQGKD